MSMIHEAPHAPDILSQLLEPVGQMMPVKFAEELAAMRAAPEVQARIDELADKCNEGELTPEERAEYKAYVDAIDVISILQAKARAVLARRPNS
jgi:translation elongation factor EF-Tu-like GTPase